MTNKIRIMLVDDHAVVRKGIREFLEEDKAIQVVAEASVKKEEDLVASVDLARNKKIQEGWGFLRNRRPDTYKVLIEGKIGGTSP